MAHQQAITLKRPVKVLFLHPSNELYGSDLVLYSLVTGLDRHKFYPIVLLANDLPYEGALSKAFTEAGVECYTAPLAVIRRRYFKPQGILQFWRRIRSSTRYVSNLVKERDIQIIHSNTLAIWTGAFAARKIHCPHIWHIHEMIEHPKLLNRFLQWFAPSHSETIISVCQAGLDHLCTTPLALSKSMVMYNGLDALQWDKVIDREKIRSELGYQPNDIVIGMIARISSFKAPDTFISAIQRLQQHFPTAKSFIAGSPVPGQEEMVEKVETLIAAAPYPENIQLLGFRKDVAELMASLDILVQPSRDPEMCSMTILQAMFSSKPVVATDVGGNKELVLMNETGILVPKEDISSLQASLEYLITNSEVRYTMGLRGKERAKEMFTLQHQIDSFNEILWNTYKRHAHSLSLIEKGF